MTFSVLVHLRPQEYQPPTTCVHQQQVGCLYCVFKIGLVDCSFILLKCLGCVFRQMGIVNSHLRIVKMNALWARFVNRCLVFFFLFAVIKSYFSYIKYNALPLWRQDPSSPISACGNHSWVAYHQASRELLQVWSRHQQESTHNFLQALRNSVDLQVIIQWCCILQ